MKVVEETRLSFPLGAEWKRKEQNSRINRRNGQQRKGKERRVREKIKNHSREDRRGD